MYVYIYTGNYFKGNLCIFTIHKKENSLVLHSHQYFSSVNNIDLFIFTLRNSVLVKLLNILALQKYFLRCFCNVDEGKFSCTKSSKSPLK